MNTTARTARKLLAACCVGMMLNGSLAGCLGGLGSFGHPAPPQVTGVSFAHRPASGSPGSTVSVCWRGTGNGPIPATGVLTNTSRPDSVPWDGPRHYPGNASSPRAVSIPGRFCTNVTLPRSGSLYILAYANGSDAQDVHSGMFQIHVD